MNITHNIVGWFEIPVLDMERAIRFYEAVFALTLERMQMGPLDMAMFPSLPDSIGSAGALVGNPASYQPGPTGVLIYFTAFSGDVAIEAARAEQAGGHIVIPKRLISNEIGHMAVIADSEGNRIALHCRQG